MKKLLRGIALICLSAGICFAFVACGDKNSDTALPPEQTDSYSIFTKLDLSVDFNGDTATAKVKNTFTLFPATARVNVYLYYSENYTTDYTQMQETATAYIDDLDQGETICASWDTKGRGGYFLARMRYKIDSREWEERCTEIYSRDYTAVFLEPIEDDGSLPVFEDIEPMYDWRPSESERIFHKSYYECDAIAINLDFANEYEKRFNKSLQKDYFMFSLKTNEYDDTSMPNYNEYRIFKSYNQLFFSHEALLDIKELGYNPPLDKDPTGIGRYNLCMEIISVNIEGKDLSGKLEIKFGKRSGGNFVNIYIGKECICTCYYWADTEKEISSAFLYNLFVDNLTNEMVVKV